MDNCIADNHTHINTQQSKFHHNGIPRFNDLTTAIHYYVVIIVIMMLLLLFLEVETLSISSSYFFKLKGVSFFVYKFKKLIICQYQRTIGKDQIITFIIYLLIIRYKQLLSKNLNASQGKITYSILTTVSKISCLLCKTGELFSIDRNRIGCLEFQFDSHK